MLTAPQTASLLNQIRNADMTLEQVVEYFACSADFAAGVLDAVLGDSFFVDGAIDWCETDEQARADYRAGFATGEALLDDELHAGEAQPELFETRPTFEPMDESDIPF